MRAQLVTSSRTKLEPLDPQDVFRRVANIHASSTNPGRVGPLPIPKSTRNKKAEQQFEEVSRARFAAAAVEPHSTQSGFLFFDVAGISQPVAGAHLYVTGVRDGSGNDLMYFEIPLIPANAASPGGL